MGRNHSVALNVFYRVWPDGTVQAVSDGPPLPWKGGDYKVVEALDEASALERGLASGWL
ncbi:hypothetical protein [Pulveribacter sp.]|uniref:hypothetical protein n=1 Tax=Pulveribacter sp. TaxID=2678893 RepID=UPI0028AC3EAA|nr:hypothetical protein [Pulveribacter sp.]